MKPLLPVDLNRRQLHEVEAPAEFAASGPFAVALRNHGEGVHVHLHLDDDLSTVANLEAGGNHFVDRDSELDVPVSVQTGPEPVQGRLKIVTAYGKETANVNVTVEPETEEPSVEVDETLSRPPQPEPEPDPLPTRLARRLPARRTLPVVAFGAIAIAIAAATVTYVNSQIVTAGVAVVVVAVLGALVLLWQ